MYLSLGVMSVLLLPIILPGLLWEWLIFKCFGIPERSVIGALVRFAKET